MMKVMFNTEYKGKKISEHVSETWLALPVLIIVLALFTGWCMNIENVFTYFPGVEQLNQVETIGQLPIKFVVSFIGLFVFFVGAFVGFIW